LRIYQYFPSSLSDHSTSWA